MVFHPYNRPAGRSLILILVAVLLSILAVRPAAAQNRIENFRVVEISDAELRVIVDYFYGGEFGTEGVFIHATPEEKGGVFDPRLVDFDEEPLKAGQHEANLTIKKVAAARSFASVAITVCMSTKTDAILCKNFPLQKTWRTAATEKSGQVSEKGEATKPSGLPQISSFSAAAERVPSGNATTLSWRTDNADVILFGQADPNNKSLLAQARTVPLQGSIEVRPTNTTTYILQAEKQGRSTRKQLTVDVVPSMEFSFDAPKRVCPDRPFTLSWKTRHATDVTLNGRQVPSEGSRRIRDHRQKSTFTYTLVAKNEFESLEAHREIQVVPCPKAED